MDEQMVSLPRWHYIAWLCVVRKELDRGPQQMKVSAGGADDQGV